MKCFFLIIFLIIGCGDGIGETDCCKDHGGIAICYNDGYTDRGHLMCKDGFKCIDQCY